MAQTVAGERRLHHDRRDPRQAVARAGDRRRRSRMAPGSVIVDLAAERGGNCELTKPDETVVENGVTILGPTNLPSEVPAPRQPDVRQERSRTSCN